MRFLAWLVILLANVSWPVIGQSGDPVRWSAEWCLAEQAATVEALEADGCRWQPLSQPSGLLPSGDGEIWLRVQLFNEAPQSLERWLTLGNRRLQSVTLFEQHTDAQDAIPVQQGGRALPANMMSPAMREAGAFSLHVPASASVQYWIRIQSNSLIAVHLTLWQPESIRAVRVRHDGLWMLGLGMSLSLVILALAMGAYGREVSYLYFALTFLGQILVEMHFSNSLQRGVWPPEWSLPFGFALVGMTLLVVGGAALITRVVTPVSPKDGLLRSMIGVSAVSLAGLIGSMSFDYPAAAHVWLVSGITGGVIAAVICARAWQLGSEAAGYLLGAVLLLLLVFGFRVLLIYGQWPESVTTDTVMLAMSLIAGAWVLWSLVRRSVEKRKETEVVKESAASQLALFARISHELRTPLDTILGNAQLLLRQRGRPPEVPVLKAMLDSGRHLLGMIDELLDYARGVSGSLKIEPVATRFDTWLRSLERTGELLSARNQNIFMTCFEAGTDRDLMGTYEFDASRLRQVVDNLLVNAARYTREGSITLGGRFQRSSDAPQLWLNLYVEDTGCGIAPENHERVFEPFERLDRTARAGGVGTGMGLPIARQLVTLMGGELTLLSALGRGARFTVTVPIKRSQESVVPTTERSISLATAYRGHRRKILLVDDDDHSRRLVQRMLESVGFEVSEATGGREAERMLESTVRFDVVLTDQFMPDGDGWWVLWATQKHQPEVPVVLISAALPHEPLGWSGEKKFAAIFLRPIAHDELLQKMGDLLGLQWIFDEPAEPGAPPSVQRPDRETLTELQQLVAFGEVTAIREWAQSLRAKEPRFAYFADAVEQAVIELDFGRLELLVADE